MSVDTTLVQKAFDNGLDAVAAFDENLRFVYWSTTMAEVSEVPAARALGCSAYQLFPELREHARDEPLRAALRGEQRLVTQPFYGARTAGANYEWFVVPLRDGSRVSGAVSVARSRSLRANLEERLAETEQRFRTMADCSPVLLWMSGEDSLCHFFNQTWLEFSGRTLEQEVGVGWVEGVHPEDFERCMNTYMRAFDAREAFEMEYRLRRHDGQYRWLLDRGAPRYMPAGGFAGFIGSCVDITDRKDSEQRALSMASSLSKTNQHLEHLLYASSHDLREPIRMVTSFLELLERRLGAERSPEVDECISYAREGAARMRGIVDGLLDFASVRRGELKVEDVSLKELVQAVLLNLKVAIDESSGRVELRQLPVVRGDALRLRSALQNLIGNALKFRGEDPPLVVVSTERRGDDWIVSVKDNGVGFDMDYAEQAFGIFKRLHGREQFPGNGLGLAVVREVAHLHGGRAWATSEPGQGSTFCLSIPAGS